MNQIDEAAHRALRAKVRQPLGTRVASWYDKNDMRKVAAAVFAFACLLGVTAYEMSNAALGAVLFAKGVIPSPIAFVLGAGLVVGYIGFHRSASEDYRAKQWYKAGRATIAAVIFALVSLFFVFSNTSSKTGMTAQQAMETNTKRAELVIERDDLYPRTTENFKAQTQALINVTNRQIESFEAEAVGWDLSETKMVDGETVTEAATPTMCARNLRPRARIICNELNGSSEGIGLRNELLLHEAAMAQFERDSARIKEVNGMLARMPRAEGQAHWQAMQDVSMGAVSSETFRIFGALFVSMFLLLGAGFGWDLFFEARQAEKKEQEEAEGAPA